MAEKKAAEEVSLVNGAPRKWFFVENNSNMVRCASAPLPANRNPLATVTVRVVRLEMGLNLLSREEYDIVRNCPHLGKQMRDKVNGFIVERMYESDELPLNDSQIRMLLAAKRPDKSNNIKQEALLKYLYAKTESADIQSQIKERLPSLAVENVQNYKFKPADLPL